MKIFAYDGLDEGESTRPLIELSLFVQLADPSFRFSLAAATAAVKAASS